MDKFLSMIVEDMVDEIEADIIDDSMEEAICFLTGMPSSFEILDECSKGGF